MKNSFGNNVTITLFGESHGTAIGAVLDGIPAGIKIDEQYINSQLQLRKPVGNISTARKEEDNFELVSGVFNGFSAGTPICIMIKNTNTISKDYSATKDLARLGHADYTANEKYHGYQDYRGGGHFSGRLTAPLVAAGAICLDMLKQKGIKLATHIKKCGGIEDDKFNNLESEIDVLNAKQFACLCEDKATLMKQKIEEAASMGDSVGGILETVVIGLEAGVGEPFFDSIESLLAHALFSIPAIKGVQFGMGFEMSEHLGSEVNDAFYNDEGVIKTKTNHNGGINGGISNGMPLQFSVVVKPTPSIYKGQETVNMQTKQETTIQIQGRHDPAIIHRARVVVDSLTALVLVDLLMAKYGSEYFCK